MACRHRGDAKTANSCHHCCHDQPRDQGFNHAEPSGARLSCFGKGVLVEWVSHGDQLALGMEIIRPLITPPVIDKSSLMVVSLFDLSGFTALPKVFFGVV